MTGWQALVLALASYLVGSLPFGVLVARSKGVDLAKVGSGNVGATNVARTLGWGLGMLVFLLDVLKGVVPALWAKTVIGTSDAALMAGVIAVIGHTFSPFLRFKGGKGVATSLGALIGSAPMVGVIGFSGFLVVFAATRIVSVSSLVGALTVLVAGYALGQNWFFFAVFVPVVTFVFIKHASNIKRLLRGEEPRMRIGGGGKKQDAE